MDDATFERLQNSFKNREAAPAAPAAADTKSADITMGGALWDATSGVASGALGLGQAVVGLGTTVPGLDMVATPVYKGLGAANDFLRSTQSDAMQQARTNVHGAWDDNKSLGDNFSGIAGAAADNPYYAVDAVSNAIGSGLGMGKLIQGVSAIPKIASMSTAGKVGVASAMIGAGTTSGEIAANGGEWSDRWAAVPAGAVYGATGYLGSKALGSLDLDTAFARVMGATAPQTAGRSVAASLANANPMVKYPALVGLGAVNEGAQEFAQSGADVLFPNLGLGRDPWEGVAQAAVIGSITGAIGGGALGPIGGMVDKRDLLRNPPPTAPAAAPTETQAPAAPVAPAAPTAESTAFVNTLADTLPEAVREQAKAAWNQRVTDIASMDVPTLLDALTPPPPAKVTGDARREYESTRRGVMESVVSASLMEASDVRAVTEPMFKKLGVELPAAKEGMTIAEKQAYAELLGTRADAIRKRAESFEADAAKANAVLGAVNPDMDGQQAIQRRDEAKKKSELLTIIANTMQQHQKTTTAQVQENMVLPEGMDAIFNDLQNTDAKAATQYVRTAAQGRANELQDGSLVTLLGATISSSKKAENKSAKAIVDVVLGQAMTGANPLASQMMSKLGVTLPTVTPDIAQTAVSYAESLASLDAQIASAQATLADGIKGMEGVAVADKKKTEAALRKEAEPVIEAMQMVRASLGAQNDLLVRQLDARQQEQKDWQKMLVGTLAARRDSMQAQQEQVQAQQEQAAAQQAQQAAPRLPPPAPVTPDGVALTNNQLNELRNRPQMREPEANGQWDLFGGERLNERYGQPAQQAPQEQQAQLTAADVPATQGALATYTAADVKAAKSFADIASLLGYQGANNAEAARWVKAQPVTKAMSLEQAKAKLLGDLRTQDKAVKQRDTQQRAQAAEQARRASTIASLAKDPRMTMSGLREVLGSATDADAKNTMQQMMGLDKPPTIKEVRDWVKTQSENQPSPKSVGRADNARPAARLGEAVTNENITDVMQKVADALSASPLVTLVDNTMSASLPQEAKDVFTNAAAQGKVVKGFYYQGQVYINTAAHTSDADLLATYMHEVVGHHGVRGTLGDRLNPVLDEIADARPLDVMVYAHKYNLDVNIPEQRREATEEMIAGMAETLASRGLLKRLMDMLKAWWSDVTGQQATDAQIIRDILTPAAGFVGSKIYSEASNVSSTVRYRLGTTPDPADSPTALDLDTPVDHRDTLTSVVRWAREQVSFTTDHINRLATRIPAALDFLRVWQEQQNLNGAWERTYQAVGQKYVNLKRAQNKVVSEVLAKYSATGNLPFIPTEARLLSFAAGVAGYDINYRELTAADVTLAPAAYNALDADSQLVVQMTVEAMAKIRMSETEVRIRQLKTAVENLRQSGNIDAQKLSQLEAQALGAIVNAHNTQIVKGYIPQTRQGQHAIVMKSPEYLAYERQMEELGQTIPFGDPMRQDENHYIVMHEKTAAEAIAREKGLRKMHPNALVTRQMRPVTEVGNLLGLSDLTALYDRLERARQEDNNAPLALSRQVEQEMMMAISQLTDDLNSMQASSMQRENINGLQNYQVMENVLQRVRDFGYYYSHALTAPQKYDVLRKMRAQVSQLTGDESANLTSSYNRLMAHIAHQQNHDTTAETASRGVLGFSSFMFLLSNPSYFALQLTQTPLVTLPVLGGQFGMAKSTAVLTRSYIAIKGDVLNALRQNEAELTFSSMSDEHRAVLLAMQSRNRLDVGISQEFGALHGGVATNIAGRALRRLYNLSRSVEIINRASATIAAYDLRVEQLLAGRSMDSLTESQKKSVIDRATNYADEIVYRTHGDYSLGDAPMAFRGPAGRVLLQFKKIGLIMGRLVFELAREGWAHSTVSARGVEALSVQGLGIPADLVQKLTQKKYRLRDNELLQLRTSIESAISSGQAQSVLSEKQLDVLNNILMADLNPDIYITQEDAISSRKSFAYLLGTSAAIAGTVTIPFLTMMIAMAAKAFDDDCAEDADCSSGDKRDSTVVLEAFGPEVGGFLLKGFAGSALGIDISSRLGLNFVDQLFGATYNNFSLANGDANVKDALYGLAGPTVSYVGGFVKSLSYLDAYASSGSNHDLMKGLGYMAPLGVRNLITANLWDREGLVSDAGVTLMPPEAFSTKDKVNKALGFQDVDVSNVYNMRRHTQLVEQAITRKKLLLKRGYADASRNGDSERMDDIREKWRDLQANERGLGFKPSPLSDLHKFVIRQRRREAEAINGIRVTARNREMVLNAADLFGQSPEMME